VGASYVVGQIYIIDRLIQGNIYKQWDPAAVPVNFDLGCQWSHIFLHILVIFKKMRNESEQNLFSISIPFQSRQLIWCDLYSSHTICTDTTQSDY
jgi:hypothetical protein